MSDFFGALELELRAAAERPPRRPFGVGQAIGMVAAAALVAVAVAVAMTVSGGGGDGGEPGQLTGGPKPDPVGTVIPRGEGNPSRSRRSTVVATGRDRGIGPWQLEASRSVRLADPETDEEYQPAGLRCLTVYLLDPPGDEPFPSGFGQCGEFRRNPGLSILQVGDGPVLLLGRAPERAMSVLVMVPGRNPIAARIHEGPSKTTTDFYSVRLKPPLPRARVMWFRRDGQPGGVGIKLFPPVTRQRGR